MLRYKIVLENLRLGINTQQYLNNGRNQNYPKLSQNKSQFNCVNNLPRNTLPINEFLKLITDEHS